MMAGKYFFIFLIYFISVSFGCEAQNKPVKKYSFHFGYGIAGSFFVRSYVENEIPGLTSFYKKNFIGSNLNVGFDRKLGDKFELSLNYTLQEFSRRIDYSTVINNVQFVIMNHSIRHTNNIYDLTLRRTYVRPASQWGIGIGLYYLRPIQQEIDIFRYGSGAEIVIQDRDQQTSRLNEAGSLIEAAYEKQFQKKVYIGIKSQLFFTVSTGEFESVSLFPYIKLLL